MGMLDNAVTYFPATGDVERNYTPNRVPERATSERESTRGAGIKDESVMASIVSGIGRIDWSRVLSIPEDELEEYALINGGVGNTGERTEIELLSGNEKTKKPRPSGKFGEITGLSVTPHFYPNLLNVIEANEQGRLAEVEKDLVNAFNGTKASDAVRYVNRPGFPDIEKSSLLNFCAFSSQYCRATCLVTTGNNPASDEAVNAKMRKTYMLLADPERFVALLHRELNTKGRAARRGGRDLVVRLNMLSDIPWYVVCPELLEAHSQGGDGEPVVWYDYTKVPFWKSHEYHRVRDILDLTFSFSGTKDNLELCREALAEGYRIAVAMAPEDPNRSIAWMKRTTWREIVDSGAVRPEGGKYFAVGELAREFGGEWEVVDGDGSDYRVDDPGQCLVALNFKQPNIRYEAGWGVRQKKRVWLEAVAPHLKEAIPLAREKFTMKVPDRTGRGQRYVDEKSRVKIWRGIAFDLSDFSVEDFEELRDSYKETKENQGPTVALEKATAMACRLYLEPERRAGGDFAAATKPNKEFLHEISLSADDFSIDDVMEITAFYDSRERAVGAAQALEDTKVKAAEIYLEYRREHEPRRAFPNARRSLPMANAAPRSDQSLVLDENTSITMFRLGRTGLLIGPHVPTIEND